MDGQMLSTLSRGRGFKGRPHDDHKPKYPPSIPYFLRDVSSHKTSFPPIPRDSKYRTLPGTYLTEKGQMILYTKAKKPKGIENETANNCKKISKLYDIVQSLTNEIKKKNVRESRKELNLGDVNAMLGSLKNDWFYPKKWNSPAKELIPTNALMMGYNIKDFLKYRKPNIGSETKSERIETYLKNNSNSLPNIHTISDNLTYMQRQNNAAESSYETQNVTRSITGDCSASIDCTWNESLNGSETPLEVDNDSFACPSSECFYDVQEEYLFRRNTVQNSLHHFDDKELFNIEKKQIEIIDVLGGDSILSDIKTMDINKIAMRRQKSSKNDQCEELRISLLKDLYEKLNFLSLAKHQLKAYSQNLLCQFLEYNSENRKLRIKKEKEQLYTILQEMKERNDEIKIRIQKISEKKILDKKDSIDKIAFSKEWDQMLLDLSRKSKFDYQILEIKRQKLIQEEENKIKAFENNKMEIENTAIMSSFTTLRNELIKLEEEKHDIEHFIIRLEMGRENVNKIEKEISVISPPPFKLSKTNFQSYFNKIKEDTIFNWKLKMYDFGQGFKVDESKLPDMLLSESDLDSSYNGKGDINSNTKDINLNACLTEENGNGKNKKISDTEDFLSETNKSQSFSNIQKNYSMKLDYELMKLDQRISSNYTYSYFIPWPKENYERNFVPLDNMNDSDDEGTKPSKMYKLNYKRILAHNPLKERKLRSNRKPNI